MANIRKFQMRRLSIKGGSEQPISIQSTYINVLRFINWGAAELRVSGASDPQLYPQVIVNGNGGTNNLMDPAGIERIFVYAAADITFGLIEMQVEDPMLILAMESVVANLMTALPAGTNHVGDVGVEVAGVDVSDAAPFPVKPGAGITFDVADRAARAAGKVGLQVAAADVAAANPVPVTPGTGATFDVSDRVARALGTVTVDKVTGILSTTISADNAAATITLAAPGAGVAHYVWGIIAGFVGGAATKLLTVKDGAAVKENIPVVNGVSSERTKPVKITDATALEVSLAASGTAGVIGYVTVLYETR